MPIDVKINEDDYILYEILCDYCDEEYVIKYKMKDESLNRLLNVVLSAVI